VRSFGISALAGVTLFLGACTYWEPYSLPASPSWAPSLPSSLRVASEPGHPILLVEPFLKRDTLFGRVGPDTIGIPLHGARDVQRQRVDGLRTLGLIVGGSAAWITVGLLTGGLQ
jgi:hypothetical protein